MEDQKAMRKIFVLGSINMDVTTHVERFPSVGATVSGNRFLLSQGGKGANQAVAVAKLGGDVMMVGAVGNDAFGQMLLNNLKKYGVSTSLMKNKLVASGTAVIVVDDEIKNNVIIVNAGANGELTSDEARRSLSEHASAGDILIVQLEIPLETVIGGLQTAKEIGMATILNPAPAPKIPLSSETLALCDYLVPNETEAEFLCGFPVTDSESGLKAYKTLSRFGLKNLLVTLGERGSLLFSEKKSIECAPYRVEAVDTTAAGDTYIGAFAVAILEGKSEEQAMQFATKAAALTVTRPGASDSIPNRAEVDSL